MTVRDVVSIFKNKSSEIKLSWNGILRDFDKEDKIELDAFGRYEVDNVVFSACQIGESIVKHIEIEIVMAHVIGKETTA